AGWPGAAYEERSWAADEDGFGASRRARLRARGPYQAAVPPRIAELSIPPLDADTQVATEDALAELARFDGELGVLAAPFAAILLRTESASSSEIEQLTAQPKGIALAELGRRSGPNAHLIVANVRAMEAAVALADSL